MSKILYIIENEDQLNVDADVLVLPVLGLAAHHTGFSFDSISNIMKLTSKEVYFLMDAILFEDKYLASKDTIKHILSLDKCVLYSDMAVLKIAREMHKEDNLIYYSPTLMLNPLELDALSSLKVNKAIISKECEYEGYLDIKKYNKDAKIGMLALGYPQIYFSHRKMLTSYEEEFGLKIGNNTLIKEKTRDFKMHILERDEGTYIFASEVFFPGKYLKNLNEVMDYLLIDSIFINKKDCLVKMVKDAIEGKDNILIEEKTSYFTLFKEMINNYEKN